MRHLAFWISALVYAGGAVLYAQSTPQLPKVSVTRSEHGFDATIGKEVVHVIACSDAVIHVVTRPEAGDTQHPQPWLLPGACAGVASQFSQDAKAATLTTAKLAASISLTRGNLSFTTADGEPLLRERDSVPRTYVPTTVAGQNQLHIVDRFSPDFTEAFYGLGQHQSGMFNYRGSTVELGQNNTDIGIPFLVSSKGYAVLWNTAAFTYVDNRFPLELSFDSMDGDGVDYFVVYGPQMDTIIHQYRDLTGHAPMLPRWSYGFIQSKDRYKSLSEIETIADRYRSEHIPLDTMVQDWFWWKTEGDPIFNENYHGVPADLKKLHDEHVHTMISTWGLMDTNSQTYARLNAIGGLIPNAHVYDSTNPKARDLYFQGLIKPLLDQGWDSFWLDSAEPEEYWPHVGDAILRDKQLAIGPGSMYTNIFPLMHTEGVQNHWLATRQDKRVFLLTRSAFLGEQRVGATVWSGDVFSSFWGLKHQVAAGLNYALTGLPYWTTDIGGYWPVKSGASTEIPNFQELYLRWFEFGTFCPIFRSHGHRPANEMWSYPQVEPALIQYDKLRYRLMPYIYSLAWQVSSGDSTIMRPLVMDFRTDEKVWNIGDQFMFGPALLVNPVVEAGATSRRVYLPKSLWYDFWTGATLQGGTYVEAAAPPDRIPLYVRAGSILPMGPDEDYTSEKPNGPIELRAYRGADGSFTLYQDSGDGYGYQHGERSIIPITWSDSTHTLTLGARQGTYPGMPQSMQFHIVWVTPNHGIANTTTPPDATITYTGAEKSVRAN